ncbi:MAG: hypothetical protein ABEH83_14150 [Halobacterium sp.]
MVEFGPEFYVIAGAILLFVFFLFLFVRRTLAGFREGFESGKRD